MGKFEMRLYGFGKINVDLRAEMIVDFVAVIFLRVVRSRHIHTAYAP